MPEKTTDSIAQSNVPPKSMSQRQGTKQDVPLYLQTKQPATRKIGENNLFEETQTMSDADIELELAVPTRVKNRIEEIQELSRAKHRKVQRGNQTLWKTTDPVVHLSGLSHTIQNGIGMITYHVYKKDKSGNKLISKVQTQKAASGNVLDIMAHYVLDVFVVETIENRKELHQQVYPAKEVQ